MSGPKHGEISILVVDDDADILTGTAHLLRQSGYVVTGASNGLEALQVLPSFRPQLVLSDRDMPKMDGMELCRRIKGDPALADIFVVLISGETTQSEEQGSGLEAGADGYITRPIANRELVARVAAFIRIMRLSHSLRESREKLNATLASMTDAVFISDRSGQFIEFNDAFATFHRFKNKAECGSKLTDFHAILDVFMANGELAPLDMWAVPRALRGEMAVDAEYSLRRKDTGETWVGSYSFGPIRGKDGGIVGSVVVGRDITEQKRAVAALQTSEQEFRSLAESLPQIVWVTLPDGWNIYINQKWVDYTGLTLAESLGHEWNKPFHPADKQRATIAWQQATTTGSDYELEVRLRRADGTYRWWLIRAVPLRDASGQILKWFGTCTEIEGIKQAEAALRASNQRLEDITFSLADWVWETDEQGVYTYSSPQGFSYFGPRREDVIGRTPFDFMSPEEAKRVGIIFADIAARKAPIKDLENWNITKNGERICLLTNGVPILDVAGNLKGYRGVGKDITERKAAEDKATQSHNLLANLARLVPGVIYQYRLFPDGRSAFPYSSPGMNDIYEVTPAEVREDATPVFGRLHPDDYGRVGELIQESARTLRTFYCEFRVILPRQGLRWRWSQAQPERMEDGGTLWHGIISDITERKQAEERLRRQAALLDAASDAIYVRALDHTITYWNVGAERLYGWSPAEAIGRKLTELGLVEPVGFATAHAALLTQSYWSGEVHMTDKNGKEHVTLCRWTLLRDGQGQPTEVLAINTDITDKKQLESQFLRAQRMEGIGMLAGGIAHDLNNILTPVMMSTSLLRAAVHDDVSHRLLDSVLASTQRGADIIRQLLTFARGQPGVRAPVPVRQLLREMEKLIRATFPRNLYLTVTVLPELWPLVGDATQIHQALMNLCVNARDAMTDGGTLTLTADNVTLDAASPALMPAATPGPCVRLCVSDTGTGIPPAQLEHIFDPFFTTKEIGKGTGLGLSTVLGIVRGHGGSVRVDSRVGQGTTIELYFPAALEAKAADTPERESRVPRGHGELILVVDDEAAVRDPTQQLLQKYGYRVLTAAEGATALALFVRQRTEVKAVLTDLMMPGMDGPKLVRALRQLDARLPILGMTGLLERAAFKGMEEFDAVPLLAKPFEAEKLLVALHQILTAGNPTTGPANGRDGLCDASR